jgi:hypothetical protein
VAGRQRPDRLPGGVIDADLDELGQHPVIAEHSQGAVAGVDQLDGRPHDLPQRLVQLKA